jgi:hypothetical protein
MPTPEKQVRVRPLDEGVSASLYLPYPKAKDGTPPITFDAGDLHVHEGSSVKVGDRVRSFDFASRSVEGEDACYVEGVVEAIGREFAGGPAFADCARYQIRVRRRVFAGEELTGEEPSLVGGYVYPPVNGTPTTLGEITDGVVVIET